jgi:hypothetical protein
MKNNKWKNGTLLTMANAKTVKGEPLGYLTGILYLAPAHESVPFGGKNVCPWASAGCRAACLFTAGRGRFNSVRAARIAKTVYMTQDPEGFRADLVKSIRRVERKAARMGLKVAIRLNGTSDIDFSEIYNLFPRVQFYNYTKSIKHALQFARGELPKNVHVTYSRTEDSMINLFALDNRVNIAVVFEKGKLPAVFMGRKVIDGDKHDLRFLDETGVVVGLSAKGAAKHDKTGFVVR